MKPTWTTSSTRRDGDSIWRSRAGSDIRAPRWIIKDGADDELKFKYTQRRHQKPTETWYRAYPGLTVYDLERNARVRAGFERRTMTDAEVRAVAARPVRAGRCNCPTTTIGTSRGWCASATSISRPRAFIC